MEENLRKQCIYLEYLADIDDYTNNQNKANLKERVNHLETILENPNLHWVDLYHKDSVNPVGFIIYGSENMCHPESDIMIYDAYVKYPYRNKRIMSRAFDILCQGRKVCMFINNANTFARSFWVRLLVRKFYTSVCLGRTTSEEKMRKHGFTFYAWEYRPEVYHNFSEVAELNA